MTATAEDQNRTEDRRIAAMLDRYADLLEAQGADGFRVRAYRAAAAAIPGFARPLRTVLEEGGRDGLVALPTIGESIAAAIVEILSSGRWSQLERLTGALSPASLFRTVPGIGPVLADRLADDLHIETFEQLETALHRRDPPIPGIGPRRRAALIAWLAQRLGARRRARASIPGAPVADEPSAALLLEIDATYRARAAAGELRLIAPERFNPTRAAWLPVMHARKEGWSFTALFSNTALAHRLGRNRDWTVIYFHRDHEPEGRRTVVTETGGSLAGRRVIRGREADCAAHYRKLAAEG